MRRAWADTRGVIHIGASPPAGVITYPIAQGRGYRLRRAVYALVAERADGTRKLPLLEVISGTRRLQDVAREFGEMVQQEMRGA